MKLLLIVDDYLPHSRKIVATMMHGFALQLKADGHEPWVLTPAPSQNERLKTRTIDGINVLYFRSGEIKNVGKVKRALNETLLSKHAWSAGKLFFRKNHFDGIIYYSPSIFWGSLVNKLKSLWKCKSYLILRDVFPQWTVDNGLMKKNSPIHRYFKFFEKINYNNADRIGVMSPSNLDFFNQQYKDISKFEVLFNWYKPTENKSSKNLYRQAFNLENKIVLFYGGNIGHAQQMSNITKLATSLKTHKNVHFVIVGKGDETDLILKEKEKEQLSNLILLPAVEQKKYFEMLNEFDIGLFTLHPGHKTHNFPGKILGYMDYSKPILGCVNAGNDLKSIINESKSGIVVESGDHEAFYQAAKKLINSAELRKSMGDNANRLLYSQFSVESAANQITSHFNAQDEA